MAGREENKMGPRTRRRRTTTRIGEKENDGVTKRDKAGQSGDGLEEQGVGGMGCFARQGGTEVRRFGCLAYDWRLRRKALGGGVSSWQFSVSRMEKNFSRGYARIGEVIRI